MDNFNHNSDNKNMSDNQNNSSLIEKDMFSVRSTKNKTNNVTRNSNIVIQELKAKNIQLEKQVKQYKDERDSIISANKKFISVLAHDLRSPFNSILNSLDLVKENVNNQPKNKLLMYVDQAINSTNAALNQLDDLLMWTVSQHKGVSLNPVKIDLQALFTEILLEAKDAVTRKNIIIFQSFGDNIYITADLQMVKSILRNLIANAIKFSRNYGEIAVSVLSNDLCVEIAIEDNGIGISSEAQEQLFKMDSFHSTPGTNNESGIGLGLLICKEFIELHGGNIWLESEENKRSLIKFRLPQRS